MRDGEGRGREACDNASTCSLCVCVDGCKCTNAHLELVEAAVLISKLLSVGADGA